MIKELLMFASFPAGKHQRRGPGEMFGQQTQPTKKFQLHKEEGGNVTKASTRDKTFAGKKLPGAVSKPAVCFHFFRLRTDAANATKRFSRLSYVRISTKFKNNYCTVAKIE
jgi:hypothetical protein